MIHVVLFLISVHMKEYTPLPVSTDWFRPINTFCRVPRLMGLPLKLQSCSLGAVMRVLLGLWWDPWLAGQLTGAWASVDPVWFLGRWDCFQYIVQ